MCFMVFFSQTYIICAVRKAVLPGPCAQTRNREGAVHSPGRVELRVFFTPLSRALQAVRNKFL